MRVTATPRERTAWALVWLLIAAIAWLGFLLYTALRSPAPAEWNTYSQAANDHLYERLNPARPSALRVVAHRGGSEPAAGEPDPGPVARLDASYARGMRLFELDFCWTSDESLVVQHDWDNHPRVPTLEDFLAEDPSRRSTLATVYGWLDAHPDAFIVTDFKKRCLECCARVRMERPDLVPQFIVQIYSYREYDLVRSQGFRNVILTLYKRLGYDPAPRLVDFVSRHPLFALTIPQRRSDDAPLITGMQKLGVPVYVHTINDPDVARTLLGRGVHGIYSDTLASLDEPALDGGRAGE